MSVSSWMARKLGVFIVLIYVAAFGTVVVSYYSEGMAEQETVERYFPAGATYSQSRVFTAIKELYGIDENETAEERRAGKLLTIVAYTDDGPVMRLSGGEAKTVTVNDVVHRVENRYSADIERLFEPISAPLVSLLAVHNNVVARVERAVGGTPGSMRQKLAPKVVVSVIYLGAVLILYRLLVSFDRLPKRYHGGYSLIFGGFMVWPVVVIVASLAGVSVLDVVRHYPSSLEFIRPHILLAWAVLLSWPLVLTVLSLLDMLHAFFRYGFNPVCAHAGILVLGWLSIPFVAIGVLFAILTAVIYFGYRATVRVAGSRRR